MESEDVHVIVFSLSIYRCCQRVSGSDQYYRLVWRSLLPLVAQWGVFIQWIGMDYWNGILEWTTGLLEWNTYTHVITCNST